MLSEKKWVPILIFMAYQLLLIANWKIGLSKPLFDVYYGRMTQLLKSIPLYFIIFKYFKVFMKERHVKLFQMPLINLEKCLIFLGKDWCLKCNKYELFKACVRYFLSNFYFFTKWEPFKKYQKCFLKSFFPSFFCSNFCNFSPSFPHFPDSKGQMEVE